MKVSSPGTYEEKETIMNEQEQQDALLAAKKVQVTTSPFAQEPGDTKRVAVVKIISANDAEDVIILDAKRYHVLVSALRIAQATLDRHVTTLRNIPGRKSVNREQITRYEVQRDAVIDVLCAFDI